MSAAVFVSTNSARATRKPTAKKPVAKAVPHEEPKSEGYTEKLYAEYVAARDKLMANIKMPSWMRTVTGFIAAVFAGLAIAYVGAVLTEFLMMFAMTFAGSAMFALVIYCLGVTIAVFGAFEASGSVYRYIADRKIDEHAAAIRGWFLRSRK